MSRQFSSQSATILSNVCSIVYSLVAISATFLMSSAYSSMPRPNMSLKVVMGVHAKSTPKRRGIGVHIFHQLAVFACLLGKLLPVSLPHSRIPQRLEQRNHGLKVVDLVLNVHSYVLIRIHLNHKYKGKNIIQDDLAWISKYHQKWLSKQLGFTNWEITISLCVVKAAKTEA